MKYKGTAMSTKTKNQHKKQPKPKYIFIIIFVIFSAILGYFSGDLILGGLLLSTGLITSYLACIGRRSGYIFGFINALLISYVAYKNNLFGSFAVNAFIFAPLEIYGLVSWSRHLDSEKDVKIRKFDLKTSIIIVLSCIAGSILVGLILSLIPTQQLAFMDSTINCLDICALILLNLRYKENWALWITSGALSIIVWSIAFSNGGENAFMRLIAAIGFLFINIYGAIKWHMKLKSRKYR